ncbi:MAG: hypothetical protein E7632_08340 [Ruminococcaceae bacterium]|nr:hypothetical protein [Oscillospiraceae bacterium]
MEICEFGGEGYMPLTAYGGWRVAIINACERLQEENLRRMERHLGTDEVFILLEGEAALYTGAQKKRFPMELGKLYCVKCGEWHCISMKPGAKAAVVENDDVGKANTEYLYFASEG